MHRPAAKAKPTRAKPAAKAKAKPEAEPAANADRLILLAHGAGAPSSSAWMRGWAARLAALGAVETFDYPYMRAGLRAPDKLPALVAAHRQALDEARGRHPAARLIVLAGKSMGGRVGCHLAADLAGADLGSAHIVNVCFGYPLRPPSGGPLRDEVLLALRTPVLFVQGSRDSMCDLDDLAAVRARMTAPNALFVVDGGNHSLEVGAATLRAQAKTQADWDGAVRAAVSDFLR